MPSFLKINFYDQHLVDLKRLDPMQPMDLGDGPELFGLTVAAPRDALVTAGSPLFGSRSLYTGYLYQLDENAPDKSAPLPVFIKWARSKQRMEELKREGEFYCSTLRKLQGVVVPNFYGNYAATDPRLHGIGCMILEQMDRGDISSSEPSNRLKLEAAYRLHKAGIRHCGLHDKESFIMHGEKVYIVGFSEAKARCGCEMSRDRVRLCPELMWVEQQFGGGETNSVLKEIGVPSGWRGCSAGPTTRMAGGSTSHPFTDARSSQPRKP